MCVCVCVRVHLCVRVCVWLVALFFLFCAFRLLATPGVGDEVFGGPSACGRTLEEVMHVPTHGDFIAVLSACSGTGRCPSFVREEVRAAAALLLLL